TCWRCARTAAASSASPRPIRPPTWRVSPSSCAPPEGRATMEVEQLASPTASDPAVDRAALVRRLDDVRQRTLSLIAVLDSATLRRQHIPILSPMVWDVGHIGNFEEQWIGQRLAGLPPVADGYQRMFDPVANPRPTREKLPLPTGEE